MESSGQVPDNIQRIAALFPGCVTEVKDADGTLRQAIDFEKLRAELGEEQIIPEGSERYQFTWPGKTAAARLASSPIRATLRPCREESVDFDTTRNLYIEGDNLDVLKLLRETYLGRVKMIYIDPPYNTGNDFVYKDDFHQSTGDYLADSGQFDDQGQRLETNTETNGRYHTDWLNMIYPRLRLARELLTDDGVIFISIDDHEVENLKKVCNEVFGEGNFVGQMIWQTATDNNPRQIATEHEYLVCFARNKLNLPYWLVESDKAKLVANQYRSLKEIYGADISRIQKELKQWVKKNEAELKGVSHYTYVDEKGVYYPGNSSNTKPGGYTFDIIHPITGKVCAKPGYGYRWTSETFQAAAKVGDVVWGDDENTIPKIKKRIETASEMLKSVYYEDNRYWTKYLASLLGSKVFENPKSVSLIERLIKFAADKSSLILDFFSGSATTAHAVMQLNSEDGGNRRFIMVQVPEACAETSEAAKAGYKNICEIGKERIRRAGKKIREEMEARRAKEGLFAGEDAPALDTGFRVLKLASTNMEDVYYSPREVTQSQLFGQEMSVKADRTPLDLLFQAMLELGITLDADIREEKMEGKTVCRVNDTELIACLEPDVPESVVEQIAKLKPLNAIFREPADDATVTNFDELFKTYSPATDRRII